MATHFLRRRRLRSMKAAFVSGASARMRKTGTTLVTLEGLLPSMRSLVRGETTRRGGSEVAHITFVWLLPSMRSLVTGETAR